MADPDPRPRPPRCGIMMMGDDMCSICVYDVVIWLEATILVIGIWANISVDI